MQKWVSSHKLQRATVCLTQCLPCTLAAPYVAGPHHCHWSPTSFPRPCGSLDCTPTKCRLAILVMNCVPREELQDSVYGDDASVVGSVAGQAAGALGPALDVGLSLCSQCRSRLALFLSYVFSVASIAAAVALLLNLKSKGPDQVCPSDRVRVQLRGGVREHPACICVTLHAYV